MRKGAGLRGRTDEEVLAYAVRDERAVVTADVGFGNVLRVPLGQHAGIVMARLPHDLPVQELSRMLLSTLTSLSRDEVAGNILTVTETRARIRRPPRA